MRTQGASADDHNAAKGTFVERQMRNGIRFADKTDLILTAPLIRTTYDRRADAYHLGSFCL
jgi:hypothetical protein